MDFADEYDELPELPTVEECKTFLKVINTGRQAIGLEPLDRLEFDEAEPMHSTNCLSARNLFCKAGASVGATYFSVMMGETAKVAAVAEAIGAQRYSEDYGGYYTLPPEIAVVTDPFDNQVEGLRDRLFEADVI